MNLKEGDGKEGCRKLSEKEVPAFLKKKMWLEKIALFCLITFAFIGTITSGIIIHEYSHYNDFRELNVTNEEVCGLILPLKWKNWSYTPVGRYSFTINKSDSEVITKYQNIDKNTEIKAYMITGAIFVFFIFCYWIIIFARYRDKYKILDQEVDKAEKAFYIQQLEKYILNQSKINNEEGYEEDYNPDNNDNGQ